MALLIFLFIKPKEHIQILLKHRKHRNNTIFNPINFQPISRMFGVTGIM